MTSTSKMTPRQLASGVHYALLQMQRRIRREFSEAPSVLGAQETIALFLVSTVPNPVIKDLVPHLHIHQTGASRLFAYLREQGFIQFAKNPNDAREKILRFTEKGQNLLARLRKEIRAISDRVFRELSSAEAKTLAELLDRLADGFRAIADRGLPGDHVTEAPRRRLTVVLGLVAPEYMGDSGLDIAEYQLLLELSGRDEPMRVGEIQRLLPFDSSKLSRSISMFARQRLLSVTADPSDKRGSLVLLSDKGRKTFGVIHERTTGRFQDALSKLSNGDVEQLRELMVKASTEPADRQANRIRRCENEQDLRTARAFLVEQLVATDRHRELPSAILPPEHDTYLLMREKEVIALLSTTQEKNRALIWFVKSPRAESAEIASLLLEMFHVEEIEEISIRRAHVCTTTSVPGFTFDAKSETIRRRFA